MCVNVRSQREIHLGVSSFRVFFLFFFEARERERRHIFFITYSPFGRALFRNGLWGKEGLREEVVVGSLFVILRVSLLEERESKKRDFYSARRAVFKRLLRIEASLRFFCRQKKAR